MNGREGRPGTERRRRYSGCSRIREPGLGKAARQRRHNPDRKGVDGPAAVPCPRSTPEPDPELDLVGHLPEMQPPILSWTDGDAPLDRQLSAVVQDLLGHAEERARAEALRWHDYQASGRARKAREAVLAAERAEKERVAREEAPARARLAALAALADGADALEQAERIRRYVAAVTGGRRACPAGWTLPPWSAGRPGRWRRRTPWTRCCPAACC